MLLKCIAIDDEPPALQIIKKHAAAIPQLQLHQVFDDGVEALEFLKENPVHLLFADINMPDINGIQLVRSLPYKPMVIFTTAHKEFAHEGFELEAIDYLLKPISAERFGKSIEKALDYYNYKNNVAAEARNYLFVRSEYRLVKINLGDIEYIEGLEDYVKIHVTGGRPVLTLMTMKAMAEKLPPAFRRIHKSYIISTARVKAIAGKKAVLGSGVQLPVSNSYIGFIRDWYNK